MAKVWHSFSIEQAFQEVNSSPEGLSPKEAEKRLKEFGLNDLPEEKPVSKLGLFFEQLKSPLVYILIIAGIITLVLDEKTDTVIIFGAVILNALVGYFQEVKANQSLDKLKKVLKTKAIVFRGGDEKEVAQKNLVPGDLIFLMAGNKAPADARIIDSYDLKINESSLTGEWLPASKHAQALPSETSLADRDNMAYMGTIIESGWGRAIVVETGTSAQIGKVAGTLKKNKEKKTPYQKKLARFSKIIGLVILAIASAIFIEGMVTGGSFVEIFATSVAVAVAAIPEGLPVAMTVILSLGMQRILKRRGLVRRLASAETLGSTSVILTDKTGTLTKAKMEVAGIYTGIGELLDGDHSHAKALKIALLCNEAFVENHEEPTERWIIRGRPTEKALLLAGIQFGLSKKELLKKEPLIDKFLFNPVYKYAASLHRLDGEINILYAIGSPEIILSSSTYLNNNGQEQKLLLSDFEKIEKEVNNLTDSGLRVVAVAYKKTRKQSIDQENKKEKRLNNMVFVGFFALHDPIREETKAVMDICRQAGMRPIIVTGDHKLTARRVAAKLGFEVRDKNILEGKDLDQMDEKEFERKLMDIHVYARVEPAQKLRIVQAWQKRGEIVAMTGDGINDAPALNRADIGVALGSGTDVAKEVSDLVLLTDNFNVIVAAIEEGRAIIDNIRKVIVYLLSDSFAEVILVGVSLFLGWPLPILAGQILWVNLIEDGPMSISLAFEKKEKDTMKQKPENYSLSLLNKEMKVLIFIIGFLTDIFLLGLFFWLLKYSGYDIVHIRSVVFAGLTIDSLFYIFSCKSLRKNIWRINPFSNRFMLISWAFGIIMLLVALYLPFFQNLLKTAPLNLFDWGLVLGLGIINIILIEATKYYFISRHKT
ncbi:MAG: HAD-IC family P-type ATPase [Candidatus Portnoybacteria bacterium]